MTDCTITETMATVCVADPPLPVTGVSGLGVFVVGTIAWCVGWALVFLVRERATTDERNTPL